MSVSNNWKTCVHEFPADHETVREPMFGVAYGSRRVCGKCNAIEYEDWTSARANGGTPKIYPPERDKMMDDNKISVTFRDIEIVYDELRDRWIFTLRGRELSRESLAKAKESISREPPKDKKPFEKIEAWHMPYNRYVAQKVTVTSIAEKSRYGSEQEAWVTLEDGSRLKAQQVRLFAVTKENDKLFKKIAKLRSQIGLMETEQDAAIEGLNVLVLPTAEDDPGN